MIYILDSTVFFSEWNIAGEWLTTPSVLEELRDGRSQLRAEVFLAGGLEIRESTPPCRKKVEDAMRESGDKGVLSAADIGLLALALDTGGTVVTDDFALQNVAHQLHVPVLSIHQRKAIPWQWRYRCTGCGRYGEEMDSCPVCGSPMKRTIR
ncbi:MAG: nucleotide-binding protein [Methanomicrobiales archaeon]|nr:nucleotide-binding protein [Methanomicrobiales archaeon]